MKSSLPFLVIIPFLAGCGGASPTAPSRPGAIHSGIIADGYAPVIDHGPAIDIGRPRPGGYLCTTQPRWYCSADVATCWLEVDTYWSADTCPTVPID